MRVTRPRRHRQISPWSGLVIGFLLTAFILAFAYTGYLVFAWARTAVAGAPSLSELALPRLQSPVRAAPDTDPVTGAITQPQTQPKRQAPNIGRKERITVLVMGTDQRFDDPVASRTDTMIVLTVDPASGKVGMLSLPRDLWVTIPGYGEAKINTAFQIGERNAKGGGPALAKATVEEIIGYPIHYYVRLNFEGFRKLIDAIGGIYVDVPKEINDPLFPDSNYGYDPLHIPAGRIQMDGELALKYARVRHVDDDYNRARRQQQVLIAVKDQLFRRDMIATLLPKLPSMASTLANSVNTDIPLDQAPALVDLGRSLDMDNIQQAVLDNRYGTESNDEQRGWILVPDPTLYRPVVDALFTADSSGQTVETTQEDAAQALAQSLSAEGASIVVLNGTEQAGLALRTSEWLLAKGFFVMGYGDADRSDYTQSVLVDYSGKNPTTLAQLATLFNVTPDNLRKGESDNAVANIRIILGADFTLPEP
jgi:polyisoprenyl-teichoic acid--peptidoglycan teichoic acid transferase